ncbi:hypothetical protein ANSO36C_20670 [Nostoc cf. commune SO-36]|uniref:Uncharacterized protein n=1 Tax=Nostoc cf. commune SO-36 TaxID=449208 RepID=A0ABN6Q1J9_NOSCO|nr:hypothetical protein ANSO36C_20670 [Nostoc cf. commune SO-36]
MLVKSLPYFMCVAKGAGKEAREEIWELTIATDSDVPLPARLEKLRKTLGFRDGCT